ncbi:MAG: hypothetical protein QNJ47_16215 [Nostocaceae cyanobacterium]|nr:hypothetical protein [Nostocaceae cyanobacterium]
MNSPEDYEKELERRERQLKEKETEIRLRELESEIVAKDGQVYQTVKHQPEKTGKPWQKKAILGLKLFALAVIGLVAVRLSSYLAGAVIVGGLAFAAYKLFFNQDK